MDPENIDLSGTGIDEDFKLMVDSASEGTRIDHFLVGHLPHYSRSQITSSIKSGTIRVNGESVKASRKLRGSEVVSGKVKMPQPLSLDPQPVDFTVVYEDDYILGIVKPPGVVVHPADGNPDHTLVNGLLYYCRSIETVGDPVRPGIVHRLDKDTSGVMVVAKDEYIHRRLVDLFKSRAVRKIYHAIVVGKMDEKSDRIVAPIGRHSINRKKMAVCERTGKYAASNWLVEEEFSSGFSLVKVNIETGRTHQIRVHMSYIGHAVAGDSLYGKADSCFPRQMLHASQLEMVHPQTGMPLKLVAPLWPDMQDVLDMLRSEEGTA